MDSTKAIIDQIVGIVFFLGAIVAGASAYESSGPRSGINLGGFIFFVWADLLVSACLGGFLYWLCGIQ